MATQLVVNWTPPADAQSQSVDYKRKIDNPWIEAITGLGGAVNTYTIIPVGGLEDNRIYQTRARSICANGGSEFISAVKEAIKFTCPELTITPTNTTLTVEFEHLGADIDAYIIKVFDAAGTNLVDTAVFNSGLAGTISKEFKNLVKNTAYKVMVEVYAQGHSKLNCDKVNATTTNQDLCGSPVIGTATIS